MDVQVVHCSKAPSWGTVLHSPSSRRLVVALPVDPYEPKITDPIWLLHLFSASNKTIYLWPRPLFFQTWSPRDTHHKSFWTLERPTSLRMSLTPTCCSSSISHSAPSLFTSLIYMQFLQSWLCVRTQVFGSGRPFLGSSQSPL